MTTAPHTHSAQHTSSARHTHCAPRADASAATSDAGRPTPTFAIPDGPTPGFLDLLRAEVGRLLNLRSTWVYAAVIMAFMAGPPVLMWLGTRGGPPEFMFEPTFAQVFLGADIVVVIAMIFAAAGSAGEISGRRTAFTYLATNSRTNTHVARMVAQVLIVIATTVVGYAMAAGFLGAVGALVPENPGPAVMVLGMLLLWTVIGSAVGMLIPFTAVAVGLPVVWVLAIEMTVSTIPLDVLQTVTEYLPWVASRQLTGMMDIGVTDLHAGLVLAVWSTVIIGGGLLLASRRDVK